MNPVLVFVVVVITVLVLVLKAAEASAHGADQAHEHASQNSAHFGSDDDSESNGEADSNSQAVADSNSVSGSNSSSSSDNRLDSAVNQALGARQSTAVSQGTNTTDSIALTWEASKRSAQTPATIVAQICQTGMSAQATAAGFSIVSTDQLCAYWRQAAMSYEAYQIEKEAGDCRVVGCTINPDIDGVVMGEIEVCEDSQNYRDYQWAMTAAVNLLKSTEQTSVADRASGQLIKPALIIALLVIML